jgi:hypothetical protein
MAKQNVEEAAQSVRDLFNRDCTVWTTHNSGRCTSFQRTEKKRYFIVGIPEEERTADSGAFCVINLGGILVSDGFSSRERAEEFIKEWDK